MALIGPVAQLLADAAAVFFIGLMAVTVAAQLGRQLQWFGFDGVARDRGERLP